ncbi:MAG: hypothetical protein IKC56_01460 [Clostridia bacterium]|nr:hypothetical protein [Clostridia bacterium]
MDKTIYAIDSLDFLNAPIDEIYHRKKHYVRGKDLNELKGILSSFFVEIEKGFRYTYFSDISLDFTKIDKGLLSRQFPILYKTLEGVFVSYVDPITQEETYTHGFSYYFWLLEHLRNLNLHAVISTNVLQTFTIDKQILSLFPQLSSSVRYEQNGVLTIAGMFIMLFSVLDLKKTEFLSKHFLKTWGSVIFGAGYVANKKNVQSFIDTLNAHFLTNYEVDIVTQAPAESVLSAILGKEVKNATIETTADKTVFCLDLSNRTNMPRFAISGEITTKNNVDIITIKQGSNIGTFYENDYTLTVADRTSFLDFCTHTPPCMALAFLYKAKILFYSSLCVTEERMFFYKKLNHPKFYRDKSVETLFYGNANSDIRELGKILTTNLLRLFLDFEEYIVFQNDIPVYHTYSKIGTILTSLNVPENLKAKIIACRNFCAHEGIINTFACLENGKHFLISFPFIFNTFTELIVFLEQSNHSYPAKKLKIDLYEKLKNPLIGSKYKRIFDSSIRLFRGFRDNIPMECEGIKKSLGAVYASTLNAESENILASEKHYSFFINPKLLELPDNTYSFTRLILNCIEEPNLEIRGINTKTEVLEFLHTPATVFNKITKNGKKVKLNLVETKTIGILEIRTFSVEEIDE